MEPLSIQMRKLRQDGKRHCLHQNDSGVKLLSISTVISGLQPRTLASVMYPSGYWECGSQEGAARENCIVC